MLLHFSDNNIFFNTHWTRVSELKPSTLTFKRHVNLLKSLFSKSKRLLTFLYINGSLFAVKTCIHCKYTTWCKIHFDKKNIFLKQITRCHNIHLFLKMYLNVYVREKKYKSLQYTTSSALLLLLSSVTVKQGLSLISCFLLTTMACKMSKQSLTWSRVILFWRKQIK